MTQDRDLSRLLDGFFADGPTQAPDRVLLVVGDRIERQRQRPAWLVRPEGVTVRPWVRPIALLAAILLIALVGATVLSIARPQETLIPIPSQQSAPTPPPLPTPIPLIAPADLAAGSYFIRTNYGPTTFTVPAGWTIPTFGLLDFSVAPIDAAPDDMVRVFFDMHIASKDAACTEAPEPGIGTSADALVADLVSDERLLTSAPVDVAIGGLTGKRVDVRIAPTTTKRCPELSDGPTVPVIVDDVATYLPDHPGPELTNGPFWGVDTDDRLRLVILDRAERRQRRLRHQLGDGGHLRRARCPIDARHRVLRLRHRSLIDCRLAPATRLSPARRYYRDLRCPFPGPRPFAWRLCRAADRVNAGRCIGGAAEAPSSALAASQGHRPRCRHA